MSDSKITAALQSQNNAYLGEMSAALAVAEVRWAQVFDTYSDAWTAAWSSFTDVLIPIGQRRQQRILADRALLSLAMDVAVVVALNAGGAAAIRLAPIATARASLFTSHLSKSWQATVDTLGRDLGGRAAEIAKAPQKYLTGQLADAEKGVRTWVLDKLYPVRTAEELVGLKPLPDGATPASISKAFKEASRLENERLAVWVHSLSRLNADRDAFAVFIPLARGAFLQSDWIAKVPDAARSQGNLPILSEAIEIALWLRWVRSLDKAYWYENSKAYEQSYPISGTPKEKWNALLANYRHFSPLAEFMPVAERLTRLDTYYARHTRQLMSGVFTGFKGDGAVVYPPEKRVVDISRLQRDLSRWDPVKQRFQRFGVSGVAKHALDAMRANNSSDAPQNLNTFWAAVMRGAKESVAAAQTVR
ncbi:MAG: hypothetical protein JNL19_04635 [Burkholderiales bacterium]|nr:hypothetical protein [Burkholderiales bacterium]